MSKVTAKVRCTKSPADGTGFTNVSFYPDYQDGRNQEWADATPTLSLSMRVKDSVADKWDTSKSYTLTFEEDPEADLPSDQADTSGYTEDHGTDEDVKHVDGNDNA